MDSADAAIWQQLVQYRDLLIGYSWLMILLVVGIFLGLAFILVRNWREGEQMNSALEHKVQERTAELAYERKLYHSLIEAMPFPVFRKDREGHITYGNSHLWPALGYTEQEAMGKTDHELSPRLLADRYRRDDLHVMESGETMEVVEDHQPRTAEKQIVRVVKTPVRDEANNVTGVQVMFWDITEGRRQSEKLREREELLSRVLDTMEDGIYILDKTGIMTFANRATERILGAQPAVNGTSLYHDSRWQISASDGRPVPEAEQLHARDLNRRAGL